MANPGYVRFSTGNDASNNGSTWTLANKTAVGAMADASPGDRVWFSHAHAEAQASSMTITSPGTINNPCQLLCGNDGAEPPASMAATAVIEVTGSFAINIAGSLYAKGIRFFINGATSSAGLINLCNSSGDVKQVYDGCFFDLNSTSTAGRINLITTVGSSQPFLIIKNSEFKFSNVNHGFEIRNARIEITDCIFTSGTAAITTLIKGYGNGGRSSWPIFSNDDFSLLDSGLILLNVSGLSGNGTVLFRDCKMPSGWNGSLVSAAIPSAGFRVEMYNCDAGDTNYALWIEDYVGTIRSFTTLYLSGTDGIKLNTAAIPLSYKMTGNANTAYPFNTLQGMWRAIVNEVTSSQTASLEIIHNESANLNEDDIWLELDYPATSGSTKFTRLTDCKSDVLASSTAQTTSTADWDDGITARANSTAYSVGNLIKLAINPGRVFICTGAGTSAGSEPGGYATAVDGDSITDSGATFKAMRRQKLVVSFTAAEQGVIRARPVLAKASATVWTASKISVA